MYQITSIDKKPIINGWEIVVIGHGEKGLCQVRDRQEAVRHSGTYAECEQWLRDRAMVAK